MHARAARPPPASRPLHPRSAVKAKPPARHKSKKKPLAAPAAAALVPFATVAATVPVAAPASVTASPAASPKTTTTLFAPNPSEAIVASTDPDRTISLRPPAGLAHAMQWLQERWDLAVGLSDEGSDAPSPSPPPPPAAAAAVLSVAVEPCRGDVFATADGLNLVLKRPHEATKQ